MLKERFNILKKLLFVVGLASAGVTFACQESDKSLGAYDAVIYLGGDCQGAIQLRDAGLRKYALPFDWTVASCNQVSELIEQKFDHFLDKGNLELVRHANGKPHYVLDKKYGVRIHHEFTDANHNVDENFMKHYDDVKQKFDRRVERLLELMKTKKNILFIRKNVACEEAAYLKAALNAVCPGQTQLTLLALDTTDEIKENWGLSGIENKYLRQTEPYDWKGDFGAWREIFKAQGLSVSDRSQSAQEL